LHNFWHTRTPFVLNTFTIPFWQLYNTGESQQLFFAYENQQTLVSWIVYDQYLLIFISIVFGAAV